MNHQTTPPPHTQSPRQQDVPLVFNRPENPTHSERGRAWFLLTSLALTLATNGNNEHARQYKEEADRALAPLISETNPEDLFDFIAGIAAQAEANLDQITRLGQLPTQASR